MYQELPTIAELYQKVLVFPLEKPKKSKTPIPENNIEAVLLAQKDKVRLRSVLTRHVFLIASLMLAEFSRHGFKFLKRIKPLFFQLLSDAYMAEKFMAYCDKNKPDNAVLYAYWFDRWANILAIAAYYKKDIRFIARAHAFDLYEEDNIDGYIPFRMFQLKRVQKVFCVSKHGSDYLKKKYPGFTDKITFTHLGCPEGVSASVQKSPDNSLLLVSCGSVQPRKRITEIPAIVAQLQMPVKWVHFGDGPQMELLKEEIQKRGLAKRIELKGHVSNSEFRVFLAENAANAVFLSISRNEGLPYTLMEAIACGVPVMATDAMGCRELVSEETGELLPLDIKSEQVAEKITLFHRQKCCDQSFRNHIRGYWNKNFNASVNHTQFHQNLMDCYAG